MANESPTEMKRELKKLQKKATLKLNQKLEGVEEGTSSHSGEDCVLSHESSLRTPEE